MRDNAITYLISAVDHTHEEVKIVAIWKSPFWGMFHKVTSLVKRLSPLPGGLST